MSEEASPVTVRATCHTVGCPVAEVTYTVPMYPNPVPPEFRAQCGQCGQPVTDIVPV
jgi:hypothetical protein